MRTTLLAKLAVAFALVLAVLVSVTPAGAQTQRSVEDLAADENGHLVGPAPPRYELRNDGTLVIDGDVFINCPSAFRPINRQPRSKANDAFVRAEAEHAEEAEDVARLCREQGFKPPDLGSADAATVSAASSATTSANASAETAELPDTGGFLPLRAGLAACAAIGLMLACCREITRR